MLRERVKGRVIGPRARSSANSRTVECARQRCRKVRITTEVADEAIADHTFLARGKAPYNAGQR
jgi:hypothetical protein